MGYSAQACGMKRRGHVSVVTCVGTFQSTAYILHATVVVTHRAPHIMPLYALLWPPAIPRGVAEACCSILYTAASQSLTLPSLLAHPLHTGAAEAYSALHACAATQLLASPLHRQASLLNPYTQVLLKLIQPYTRVRLPFISEKLNIPEKDVEQLLVSLILDNRISGYIDQVRGASVGLCGSVWSSW